MTERDARQGDRRKSSALIVALGVLSVLALLAFTFAGMAQVERDVSRNQVDLSRARMLAVSGIEYALAKLRTPPADPARLGDWVASSEYHGEVLTPGSPTGQDDADGNNNGTIEEDAALEFARHPSFFLDRDGDGRPDLVAMTDGGRPVLRGVSGMTGGGTYRADGDHFVLRVTDLSGRIYINGRGAGYERLLNNLGSYFSITGLGTRLQSYFAGASGRPFANVEELYSRDIGGGQRILGPTESSARAAFERVLQPSSLGWVQPAFRRPIAFSDCVTAWAWEDPATMHPSPHKYRNFLPDASSPTYWNQSQGGDIVGPPVDYRSLSSIEPRAPINVNAANPVVLRAVLADAGTTDAGRLRAWITPTSIDAETQAERSLTGPTATTVDALVRNLLKYRSDPARGPLRTWDQFYWDFLVRYCGGAPGYDPETPFGTNATGTSRYGGAARNVPDIVFANANPNTLLNKFVPAAHLWGYTDKADLVNYTTEFCFGPTGYYEIESLGRVLSGTGAPLAEKKIRALVRVFDLVRHTTQEDFESPSVKSSMSPDVMTLPEEVSDVPGGAYSDLNGDGRYGLGDAPAVRGGPAICDGQLTLRPADPPVGQPWGDAATATVLRALFGDSAGVSRVGSAAPGDPYPSLSADLRTPAGAGDPYNRSPALTTVENRRSLFDENGPYSDLLPEGLFLSQIRDEALFYTSNRNYPPGAGSMSFWFRPSWNDTPDIRVLNGTCQVYAPGSASMRGKFAWFYALGNPGGSGQKLRLHAFWVNQVWANNATSFPSDAGYNPPPQIRTWVELFRNGGNWNAGQWHYLQVRWRDMAYYEFWLDGRRGTTAEIHEAYDPGMTIRGDDTLSAPADNAMSVGSARPWYATYASCGLTDDLRVFATQVPNVSGNIPNPPARYDVTLPSAGYATYEGRFRVPQGARVRSIAWTEYRPTENFRGESLDGSTPARRRPDVDMAWKAGGETGWRDLSAGAPYDPAAHDGREVFAPGGLSVGATGEIDYRLTFDDGGQDPFRNAPAVDDVTVTFFPPGGPQFLAYYETLE